MGKLIAIDGLDGSGKTTQAQRLYETLCAKNIPARLISFPDYGSPGAVPAEFYLNGGLGNDPNATNPYAASTFFAVDRYVSYHTKWKDFLLRPDTVVIANRYTTANAVHQLSKMNDANETQKRAFLDWLFSFEYELLQLPRPDLVLYLELPPDIAHTWIDRRTAQTGQVQDIHETDAHHLERSYQAALFAANYLGWKRICCYTEQHAACSVEQIAQKVWDETARALHLQ